MLLNAVLSRFLTATPLAVAARGALEYALATDAVDALFDQTVGPRAGRTLLFSTCVDLMSTVVCRIHPSIHAAARATPDLPVTVSDVYARRNRMPSAAGAALVRHTAARLEPVLRAMGGAAPDRLPGYRLKILDGNHVAKTPRRLQPLRDVAAGPLPGQTLVVLDPALGLALDIVCSDDGHAQERALLGPIVASVAPRDVWLGDRNFCTTGFVFGVSDRGGYFVLRRHASTLSWDHESDWQAAGRTATGTLTEQTLTLIGPGGATLVVRRVRLTLDRPTEDGDTVIEIVTNVPVAVADAGAIADLYLERWTVEPLFQRLTTVLQCEVNTLGIRRPPCSGSVWRWRAGTCTRWWPRPPGWPTRRPPRCPITTSG
ncbi:transposase [Fimbriiglobus ruber]|uniref:Mobile element protein n=1 Tax=Fimbriiglobus ruber TaxID=1908690 RepID=A0A225DKX7_9BACT|nr:transposase [Fimbriiglobus ruber]OWK40314.1 Mobile element protein [Fimbriiglobus ruber]